MEVHAPSSIAPSTGLHTHPAHCRVPQLRLLRVCIQHLIQPGQKEITFGLIAGRQATTGIFSVVQLLEKNLSQKRYPFLCLLQQSLNFLRKFSVCSKKTQIFVVEKVVLRKFS